MDPLRPFADLVRALSRAHNSGTRATGDGSHAGSGTAVPARAHSSVETPDSFDARLSARLQETGLADPARARKTFIEVVLSWELGDHFRDPSLSHIAQEVAARIEAHPRLTARLNELLAGVMHKHG